MSREARALVTALHQNPHDLEALYAAQRALERSGPPEELARMLEWWAGYAPNDTLASRALYDAARAVEGADGREMWVLALLTSALVRDPANEQAAFRLRQLLERALDFKELEHALCDWALAVRRDGSPATLCAMASFALAHVRAHRLNDVDGAIIALEDALRAFPEHPDAKRALADLYARRARHRMRDDEARSREDFHRAAQLHYELGLFDVGEQAITDLVRALDLVPQHSAALEALIRRVGIKNLELVRKRLTAYVATAPDRVRTHRLRFELVRTLFRERRYAEALPHLRHLASRGYAEAGHILARLSPGEPLESRRPLPELPVPPSYDEEHTTTDASRLSQEDARKSQPPAARDDEYEPTAVMPQGAAHASSRRPMLDATAENDNAIEVDLDEVYDWDDPDGRPTEVLDESVRDQALRAMQEAEPVPAHTVERPSPRAVKRSPKLEHTLGLAVVAVTSAVAITSYVLGLGQ